jgi:hypothetical protein
MKSIKNLKSSIIEKELLIKIKGGIPAGHNGTWSWTAGEMTQVTHVQEGFFPKIDYDYTGRVYCDGTQVNLVADEVINSDIIKIINP